MTQSIQLLSGVVKFGAGKAFQTQYGERVNCVITLASGEEAKLWGNPDDAALLALKKGQQVQLMKDQKGYKLISEATPETPQASPQASSGSNGKRLPPTWTDDEKRAIASRTEQQAKFLRYCYDQINAQFAGQPLSEESIRTLAITLYIQSSK